jgi:hypothetical protein
MSLVRLRDAVERLAAQAKEQEAFLVGLGSAPLADELALEFGADFAAERERLPEAARSAADLLDQYLTEFSGEENRALWDIAALYTAPEWAHVRKLAAELLRFWGDETD